MRLAYLLILVISGLFLFSCEKTVNIEIPDTGRKLVLNSFFGEDSVLRVNLTKSKYILDGTYEYEAIQGAKIILFENNKLIEVLTDSSNGFYFGQYILKAGENYKLEVSLKDFPKLETESSLPFKTNILELSAYQSTDEYGWPETGFNLTFKDDIHAENYYFISVTERRYATYQLGFNRDTIIADDYELDVYTTDPNAFTDDWYLNKGILVSDDLINGKEYKIHFKASRNFYDSNESTSVYYVYFRSISKDFYLYYMSLAKHLNAQDEFFMEPVQVYSNVENGFGIFAGYSVDIDSITLSSSVGNL